MVYPNSVILKGEQKQHIVCRMRSLGCVSCTGAIRSTADTVPKIIEEMISFRRSERENRVIDHDEEGSMEIKKREELLFNEPRFKSRTQKSPSSPLSS